MDLYELVTKLQDNALDCYRVNCKIHVDEKINDMFRQKGYILGHVTSNTIRPQSNTESNKEIHVRAYVLLINEFAKLCSQCTSTIECLTFTTIANIRGVHVIAFTVIGKQIAIFDKAIRDSTVYINKEVTRMTSLLDTANDTIKQLRLELKEFRSKAKKDRKRNSIPPPVYLDERPPIV